MDEEKLKGVMERALKFLDKMQAHDKSNRLSKLHQTWTFMHCLESLVLKVLHRRPEMVTKNYNLATQRAEINEI